MKVDLNKAREEDGVLPDGLYHLTITVKPGGFGDDDLLKRARNGALYMLELELEVAKDEFTGATFREWISVQLLEHQVADKSKLNGLKAAVKLGHERIVQIVDSAKSLNPKDLSEATEAQRNVEFKELNGLTFFGYVESKTYNDRQSNFLKYIVTPDMPEWPNGGAVAATPPAIVAPPRNIFDDEIPFALAFLIVSTAVWLAAGGSSLIT